MNKDFEPIIQKYASRIVTQLIQTYHEMGLKASGKFEEELEILIYNSTKMVILGAKHSGAMDGGIRSSNSKYGPVRAIRKWIDYKPTFSAFSLKEKKSLAFAIAKKIAKEGITVPNEFNTGDVISKVLNNFLKKEVYDMVNELGVFWLKRYRSTINNVLKV
ncbi:hypothetical protein J2Q11_08635 [Tenacibaculum finnmarkense genomovar finnmarkense]|uniref:hypothetical protein n=1 Tax=Tenacibaculum finnmarkense TaxID=2781243 RepID=UPI001EFA9EED|nr:hypothetical protein [Tenacibaculum finnmarkense]MCG8212937.1 hypothetical protein [Tenacibaculum finnmarkense genomovar finnmarkense]MCG8231192.1 hypothetical protein [Tenacibaculum finnmarkense genomovar finnmarkense]MCG8884593.1 hypothetical protein [Tenacibaculum finnmarkense]MCG8897173.1 hypothetical protein [Tenacibaculum finnmarkense]MCG8903220.1 hypothetical protein [Tenacibaculum finnmarkense]